jgi:hypothetical protein
LPDRETASPEYRCGWRTSVGINSELPDFILGLYRRAAAVGHLQHDNASLIEVFRRDT